MKIRAAADEVGAKILGPNCPGIIIPGETKIGIMPASAFAPGRVGVVSRSGTLTYEIANLLSQNGIGQSAVVGIGGDPVSGLSFVDILELFDKDEHTDTVLLVGEIGGRKEEDAAEFIKKMQKPLIAFVTGRCAPPGKRMGHAGAIIRADETAENKMRTLKKAGALVAKGLNEIPGLVRQGLVM
jgi:succinyl-CoA synthetase alpha subunit